MVALVEEGKERRTRFHGDADFSLATFEDLASFARAKFMASGTFRDTRFTDVTFASARFAQAGDFEGASFRGMASFNGATFRGEATFSEGDFRQGARFVQTKFLGGGVFTRVQFGEDTSFLNARFVPAETSEEGARFQNVTAVGGLDFTLAEFRSGEARASPDNTTVVAIFSDVACGQSIVFRGTTFAAGHRITMVRLQTRDLVLDVDVVPQIDDPADQQTILQAVEESAKGRGDLGVANDAHYALLASRSNDYWVGWRMLDRVFYRGVAGYFVRPFRPLLVLLALATVLSLVRVAHRSPSTSVAGDGSHLRRVGRRFRSRATDLLGCLLDTLSSIKSGRIADAEKAQAVGERIEVFVYRLLLVCALLGLRTRIRRCARCLRRSSERAIVVVMRKSAVAFGLAGLAAAGVGFYR